MEVAHLYTKVRSEFGKFCAFKDVEPRILEAIAPTEEFKDEYVKRNPSTLELDTQPKMSEHEVNTERIVLKHSSMKHTEGGWPKDVDPTEQSDVQRFRKKIEKDETFKESVVSLKPIVERCLKQNRTIDIYEDYFEGTVADHSSEPPSAKGLAVFRDPNEIKRTATSIDWHPEGPTKIAVSYSILNFQDKRFSQERLREIGRAHV